jgi:hypothetical protein
MQVYFRRTTVPMIWKNSWRWCFNDRNVLKRVHNTNQQVQSTWYWALCLCLLFTDICVCNTNLYKGNTTKFYVLLTVHFMLTILCCILCSVDRESRYNSGQWPTWRTIIFSYMLISIIYMFRATSCSSSGESIVSIKCRLYITLCRWPSGMQVLPDLLETCRWLK